MFCLDLSPSFQWPVTFTLPKESGGTAVSNTFTAELRRLPGSEIDRLAEDARSGKLSDRQIAERLLIGWADGEIRDRNGANVPVNPATLAALLDVASLAGAVVKGYFEAHKQAALGN
ncbi:hypothetical protein RQP53_03560 [Paucibacter sp. APW11]|uniref:Uncharacterized protein n=1 Tax=Roseateles aquae TaxID=3077235 RepID=A0ABU3P736_9BURK|nr:hypothetical protein [Paucibacter sp. APW11]MDT8998350.1 hypothetical protein [Paucibacter sp. APW11]